MTRNSKNNERRRRARTPLDLENGIDTRRLQQITKLAQVGFHVNESNLKEWPGFTTYLRYAEARLESLLDKHFDPLWQDLSLKEDREEGCFQILLDIASSISRQPEFEDISIEDLSNGFLKIYNVELSSLNIDSRRLTHQCVFIGICLLTLIVSPAPCSNTDSGFAVATEHFLVNSIRPNQPISQAHRPIAALFRGFGQVLPAFDISALQSQWTSSSHIHASTLNITSLLRIAKIDIHWTSSLANHLQFDPASRRLALFCFPTMCAMGCMDAEANLDR